MMVKQQKQQNKKVFGVEEARLSEEFAKTKEQKDTVLAVMRVMRIPIKLKDEITNRTTKLFKTIDQKRKKINVLEKKAQTLENIREAELRETEELKNVLNSWVN